MGEILAIDPGGTTGYARFMNGEPTEFGHLLFEDIFDWVADQRPSIWVVEDYIVRAGKAANGYNHQWSRGEALQIIGAIKLHGATHGIPVELQQPSIKPAAYGWMGATYVKGKKNQHYMDALAHGNYYIQKHPEEKGCGDS